MPLLNVTISKLDVTNSINTIAHGRFLVPREAKPRPKNADAMMLLLLLRASKLGKC